MPNFIDTSAGGENDKYLIYTASPDHEAVLRKAMLDTEKTPEMLSHLCLHTFAGVRFIIRDSDGKQTLLKEIPTNFTDAKRFFAQHPELQDNSQ